MRFTLTLLLACCCIVTCCSTGAPELYSYRQPQATDEKFPVASLSAVGMDTTLIERSIDHILAGDYGEVHSVLIYKDGSLVLEEYFPGHDYSWDGPGFHGAWIDWNRDRRHNIHSAGKSVTSACVGIAIQLGHIESVDQSIFDYLPRHQDLNTDGKGLITIEHLLTMTSGLQWDEWGSSYSDSQNDVIALWMDCDDPVACILQKPLVGEPGTTFTYSGGNMVVLGEIIRNATGMDIEAFAGEHLFAPLGIEPPQWPRIGESGVVFAGDQRLTPREMLQFGATYLHRGTWDGREIVSPEWVDLSSTPYSGPENSWFNSFLRAIPPGDTTWGRRGYACAWWTHVFSDSGEEYPAYWAFGWGGQMIAVFPTEEAVVVLTGGTYTSADAAARILSRHVVPAFN